MSGICLSLEVNSSCSALYFLQGGWNQTNSSSQQTQQKPAEKAQQQPVKQRPNYSSVIGSRDDRGVNKPFGEEIELMRMTTTFYIQ